MTYKNIFAITKAIVKKLIERRKTKIQEHQRENHNSCNNANSKQTVNVEKDGKYFSVSFATGEIWKSICDDLNNKKICPEEYSLEECDNLNSTPEQRYLHNCHQRYTKEQLAFLYILDPMGVSFYVKNMIAKITGSISMGDHGIYKDKLYFEVFGVFPRLITVSKDGSYNCRPYPSSISSTERAKFYTEAELVFGENSDDRIISSPDFIRDIVLDTLGTTFTQVKALDYISNVKTAAKLMMFSGAIVGQLTSEASEFLDSYIDNLPVNDRKMHNMIAWPINVYNSIDVLVNGLLETFEVYNLRDFDIYTKVMKNDKYNVVFINGRHSITASEILHLCGRFYES